MIRNKFIFFIVIISIFFSNIAFAIEVKNDKVILTKDEFNNIITDLKKSEAIIESLKKQNELDQKHINFLNAKIVSLENLRSGKEEDYKEIIKRHEENFNLQKEQTQYWSSKYNTQKMLNPFRNTLYLIAGVLVGSLASK